jgi:hypothetical protein
MVQKYLMILENCQRTIAGHRYQNGNHLRKRWPPDAVQRETSRLKDASNGFLPARTIFVILCASILLNFGIEEPIAICPHHQQSFAKTPSTRLAKGHRLLTQGRATGRMY